MRPEASAGSVGSRSGRFRDAPCLTSGRESGSIAGRPLESGAPPGSIVPVRRNASESVDGPDMPAVDWRQIVGRVREGLLGHAGESAEAVESLLAGLDRTARGRVETSRAAAGSARAERQRASIRLVEAALGRRLLELGCEFQLEVLGPQGRRCDFLATRGSSSLAIHVKQLPPTIAPPAFSGRERALEAIARPVAVAFRRRPMSDDTWRRILPGLRRFLELASVGEEQRHLDARGAEAVSARILGPVPGETLRLIPVGTGELDARVARVRRLLRRAHGQFLPDHPNLILFGTLAEQPTAESLYALETALLGTQVERWDRFPRKGHRVAYGRADDGFWCGRRHEASRVAGWFSAASADRDRSGGWWDRDALAVSPNADPGQEEVRAWLETLLGPPQRALGL